jgi:hypothetical protein
MAAAVDHDDAIASRHDGRHLIAPVAGMARAAMQQDDRRAVAVGRIPDAGAVMIQPAFHFRCRQGVGAVRVEPDEIVVLDIRSHRSAVRSGKTSIR